MDPEVIMISLRNLRRRRLRTLFTMLGIIIAIGAITALVSITEGFQTSVQKTLKTTGNVIIILPGVHASIMSIATETISQSWAERIASIPHVEAVNPVLLKFTLFQYDGIQIQTTVMGVIPRYAMKFYAFTGPQLGRGQFLSQGSSYKAVLGYGLANGESWKVLPGQTIRIYGPRGNPFEFRVAGSFRPSGQAFIAGFIDDSVVVPLGTLQRIYNAEGKVSFIEVAVDDVKFVGYVKNTIAREIPGVTILTERQIVKSIVSIENMLSNLLLGVASIALLVGALGTVNTLLTSVSERTREIGIYRALGARRRFILEMILVEGVVMTFIGGIIGFFSGAALSYFLVWILRSRGQTIPWPVIDPKVIAIAFGITLLVGLVSSLYPAKKAADMNPADALRHIE